MQRVNTYDFYQLGSALKPLGSVTRDTKLGNIWYAAFSAQNLVIQLLQSPSFHLMYSRPAAETLLAAIASVLQPLSDREPDWDKEIDALAAYRLTHSLEVFEYNLAAELQQHDTYSVSQKAIYSTRELIEQAENYFPLRFRTLMPPEAITDIQQAGRCIAFELSTAAAFHILRATESVLVLWLKTVTGRTPKTSSRNWGRYIDMLRKCGADPKILAVLDQVREMHRNPILHPEEFLALEDALSLLGIAQSAILAMTADIEKRTPLPPALVPTPTS